MKNKLLIIGFVLFLLFDVFVFSYIALQSHSSSPINPVKKNTTQNLIPTTIRENQKVIITSDIPQLKIHDLDIRSLEKILTTLHYFGQNATYLPIDAHTKQTITVHQVMIHFTNLNIVPNGEFTIFDIDKKTLFIGTQTTYNALTLSEEILIYIKSDVTSKNINQLAKRYWNETLLVLWNNSHDNNTLQTDQNKEKEFMTNYSNTIPYTFN